MSSHFQMDILFRPHMYQDHCLSSAEILKVIIDPSRTNCAWLILGAHSAKNPKLTSRGWLLRDMPHSNDFKGRCFRYLYTGIMFQFKGLFCETDP